MSNIYDVIIVGGGPAGLSAALYAGRSRLKTLIIEKQGYGGQIAITNELENYPGGIDEDSGPALIKRMVKQAEYFKAETVFDEVVEVELESEIKTIKCKNGQYQAKTVIVASGAKPRPMGCPGEDEFIGRGISFCATCDGAFFEDFEIYVVGGGDSAIEEAIFLTRFGRKVTVIHRRDELRAAKSIQEKAFANPKIEFLWDSVIEEVRGDDGILDTILIKNVKTGDVKEVVADEEDGTFGLFVFVGLIPNTKAFEGKLTMEHGYIVGDESMKTNIDGVFVAGDCRVKTLRQVVTATADGAIAATTAEKFLEGLD